jgi:hypothetical protein
MQAQRDLKHIKRYVFGKRTAQACGKNCAHLHHGHKHSDARSSNTHKQKESETTENKSNNTHKHEEPETTENKKSANSDARRDMHQLRMHSDNQRDADMKDSPKEECYRDVDDEGDLLVHVHGVECMPPYIRSAWEGEKQHAMLVMMLQIGQVSARVCMRVRAERVWSEKTYTLTHMHTYIHTHTYIRIAYIESVWSEKTYTLTHMHTCIHTYTHTHTYALRI